MKKDRKKEGKKRMDSKAKPKKPKNPRIDCSLESRIVSKTKCKMESDIDESKFLFKRKMMLLSIPVLIIFFAAASILFSKIFHMSIFLSAVTVVFGLFGISTLIFFFITMFSKK